LGGNRKVRRGKKAPCCGQRQLSAPEEEDGEQRGVIKGKGAAKMFQNPNKKTKESESLREIKG